MDDLQEQRIVAPGYSFMQDTVGKALTYEQDRLITILRNHITNSDIKALKNLLDDSQGLYEITRIKHEPKDFSLSEIKREIDRGQQIHHLYHLVKSLLPHLLISNESIKYYASLVNYYSVFRLDQLDESRCDCAVVRATPSAWMVYLYLLCFIYHRYQRLHDNLLNSLISNVRRYVDEAKVATKERVYQYRIEANQDLQKAGQVLKLFTDDNIAEQTPFHQVQAQAFSILERPKLDVIADHITTKARFDETGFQWEHIDSLARQFKHHLRPILLAVDFAASKAQNPLIEAVAFLKEAFQKGKSLGQYPLSAFPIRFIPDKTKRYLYAKSNPHLRLSAQETHGSKDLLTDRYEFLVYRLLRNGLEAGDIFCRDSVRFRSFEDDLIDDQKWKHKEQLIADTGLTILEQPIHDHLASLQQMLEERIISVNQRIASGENEYFQIKKRGKQSRWTLQYPRASEPVNHPFFDTLIAVLLVKPNLPRQVDIGDVLHFVNQQCRFMEAFEHWRHTAKPRLRLCAPLGRYIKQELDNHALTACLVAWATNTGLSKMAEISGRGRFLALRDNTALIEYHILAAISDNFIRLETLSEANDRVSNDIAKLPVFQHYDIGETVHSSSDGQKFETQIHTINARYSPKYFGLKKGIVSYTMVANHIPVNAKIIGANEHESHYVFDILFNNTTEIQRGAIRQLCGRKPSARLKFIPPTRTEPMRLTRCHRFAGLPPCHSPLVWLPICSTVQGYL